MRANPYVAAFAISVVAGGYLAAAAPAVSKGRTFDGHPDLSGIWQTMSTANWDLLNHPAAAGPFFQLGALGAIPSGQGVVEGGEIPYQPEALKQKPENFTWTVAFPIRHEPGYQIFEYACHEGNHAMHNRLSAARAEERPEAAKTGAQGDQK